MAIYTIGHSNRSIDGFLELLSEHRIERLADVRSYPRSRRNPQFSKQHLEEALQSCAIDYRHWRELGGMRRSGLADSPNDGLEPGGFRNYADHMQGDAFQRTLDALIDWSTAAPTAVMCAEADPLHCHRRLISDALVALRGLSVRHIVAPGRIEEHRLTPFARLQEGRLIYPAAQRRLFD